MPTAVSKGKSISTAFGTITIPNKIHQKEPVVQVVEQVPVAVSKSAGIKTGGNNSNRMPFKPSSSSDNLRRGSNNYNYRLSQRRAEAVTRYLCDDCGISKDRLVPRGYGETKNVNQCANKVPCSEQEHQMNRRTEFRVIGCLSCYDNQETKLSAPNSGAKVSKCVGCPF